MLNSVTDLCAAQYTSSESPLPFNCQRHSRHLFTRIEQRRPNARTPEFENYHDTSFRAVTNKDASRGRHLSYQRSRHVQSPATSLIKIEGVDDTKGAKYVFRLLEPLGIPN